MIARSVTCAQCIKEKPWLQGISDVAISSGFSRIYNWRLGSNLSANFAPHRHLFEGSEGGFDLDTAAKSGTIRQFDDALTIHSFGWGSVDEYYAGMVPFNSTCLHPCTSDKFLCQHNQKQ